MTIKRGTQYLVLLHYIFNNKLVISVHVVVDIIGNIVNIPIYIYFVVVDIIGNIVNIPRDVGSHTNTKRQVFIFLAGVHILYLDSLHLIFRAEQIIKQVK